MTDPPTIRLSQVPQPRQEMDFLDSSFFQKQPSQPLPTPAEVRALSRTLAVPYSHRRPVKFDHLNLLVKRGPRVTIAEAQCLWIVRKILGDKVPVPEVYGWRVDGPDVFIYMQLVPGVTLKERWESLSAVEKNGVCEQLCEMVTSLRQLKQEPSDQFIGMLYKNSLVLRFNLHLRIRHPPKSSGPRSREYASRWPFLQR